MARKHTFTGSTFEQRVKYARAVSDGRWIFVSGVTGYDYANMSIAADPVAQTEQCFHNIVAALAQHDSSLKDVVRIRIIIADRGDFDAIAEVVGRHCDGIFPANTTFIAELVDPDMKVEIEVTALRPAD